MVKLVVVGLVAITALASQARATSIGFCSGQLENLGNCTKTVDFDAASNLLRITLANTSPAANGGFLTADAFNLGAADTADIQVVSFAGDPHFPAFTLNPAAPSIGGDINVAPFGTREFVISATSGAWLGGGNPSGGIPVGQSATFTLVLSADITEASLFGLNEAIRFRGFENGGSDKTSTTLTAVPEPSTLLLLGAALVGMGAWTRKVRFRVDKR